MAKKSKKYFVLNKASDFTSGRLEGLTADERGLSLERGRNSGIWYSGVLDSREKGTTWHRLQLKGGFGNGHVHMTVYASDSRLIDADGETDIEDVLKNGGLSVREIDEFIEPYMMETLISQDDTLLHKVRGRYVWFRLELESKRGQRPAVSGIKISFPKESWLKYMPEIYQQDGESASFVERYLGIFQSLYEDMTAAIYEIPMLLEPNTTDTEHLSWITEWLAVEGSEIWNEAQLRYLAANAMELYQYRGTVRFMKELLRLYTGRESYVVERWQIEPYLRTAAAKLELERLYGSSQYRFTVLLDTCGMGTEGQDRAFRRIAEMATPAGMECQLVTLKPYIFLGQYSYLGINSVLGKFRPMELDGNSAVPFATVAENKEREEQ